MCALNTIHLVLTKNNTTMFSKDPCVIFMPIHTHFLWFPGCCVVNICFHPCFSLRLLHAQRTHDVVYSMYLFTHHISCHSAWPPWQRACEHSRVLHVRTNRCVLPYSKLDTVPDANKEQKVSPTYIKQDIVHTKQVVCIVIFSWLSWGLYWHYHFMRHVNRAWAIWVGGRVNHAT